MLGERDCRQSADDSERPAAPPAPVCPACGGPLIDIRAKFQCQRCHRICETCCEGSCG